MTVEQLRAFRNAVRALRQYAEHANSFFAQCVASEYMARAFAEFGCERKSRVAQAVERWALHNGG